MSTNYMDLEVPDDDTHLHCEECNKEYEQDCPILGALHRIPDTETAAEDPETAIHSLPPGIVVKESGIPGAGLGAWSTREFPARTLFGPYRGELVPNAEKAQKSGYAWQIYKDRKPSHFIDGKDKSKSNWMRYVNCAASETEQNLVAFQFRGQIYYRSFKAIPAGKSKWMRYVSCAPSETEQNLVAFQFKGQMYYRSYKPISPGTELLVWYGHDYDKEQGIVRNKNPLLIPKYINGKEIYICLYCKSAFGVAHYYVRHLLRNHACDKLDRENIQVLDRWLRQMEETAKRQGKEQS